MEDQEEAKAEKKGKYLGKLVGSAIAAGGTTIWLAVHSLNATPEKQRGPASADGPVAEAAPSSWVVSTQLETLRKEYEERKRADDIEHANSREERKDLRRLSENNRREAREDNAEMKTRVTRIETKVDELLDIVRRMPKKWSGVEFEQKSKAN